MWSWITKSIYETLRMADINSFAGIRQCLLCSLLIRGYKWNTRRTPAILSDNPHVQPSFSPCWYKQANRVALTLFSLARAGSQVRRCGLKQASFSNNTLDNRIYLAKIQHQDSPLLSVNLKTVDTSSHYFSAYWW